MIFMFLSSTENITRQVEQIRWTCSCCEAVTIARESGNASSGIIHVDPKHQNSQPQILCVKLANIWNYSSGVQSSCNMMLHFVVSTLNWSRSTWSQSGFKTLNQHIQKWEVFQKKVVNFSTNIWHQHLPGPSSLGAEWMITGSYTLSLRV